MLTGSTTLKMQVYELRIESLNNDFTFDVSMTKIQKDELLSLENPRYKEILKRYPHLNGVSIDDVDTKSVQVKIYALVRRENQWLNILDLHGRLCHREKMEGNR